MNQQTMGQNGLIPSWLKTFSLFIFGVILFLASVASGIISLYFAYWLAYPRKFGGGLTLLGVLIGALAALGFAFAGVQVIKYLFKRDAQ